MTRRSKNVESMEAISANFDFSRNPASRLDCEILEQFGALFIEPKVSASGIPLLKSLNSTSL
jgi:hypothetical protein